MKNGTNLGVENLHMYARAEKTLKEYCRNSLYNKTLLNFRSSDPTQHFNRVHLLVTLNTPLWKVFSAHFTIIFE